MRIKKYENWKLNNFTQVNHQLHNPNLQQQSFSISQLLETPKKQPNKQNEHKYINQKYYSLTNPQITTNLNHRLLQKTQIYINNNNTNTKNMNIFRTQQQKTQREQIIKHKIKQRIKQQYVSDSFNNVNMTNRSFFNCNSNNNSNNSNELSFSYSNNRKGDYMGLSSFDERGVSRGFENYNNNDTNNNVHIKGKSLPINSSFTHKRSKSTVIRNGLITSNSSHKHHKMFKPQKLSNEDNNSKKESLFCLDETTKFTQFIYEIKDILKNLKYWQQNLSQRYLAVVI